MGDAAREGAVMTEGNEMTSVGSMTLDEIQSELRVVSGTPYRAMYDIERRRELWRRLDDLMREHDRLEKAP
jgi:hypothetical protein